MNKTEKEYAVKRIKEVVSRNLISCECKPPSLRAHICLASIDGNLKVKPSKKIIELTREKVIDSTTRYSDSPSLAIEDIFQEPDSYKKELAAFKEEEKAKKDANAAAELERDNLIDRVYLGEFEDGNDAIALAHKILPTH